MTGRKSKKPMKSKRPPAAVMRRSATAAGVVVTSAAVGLVSQPGIAAASTPDYVGGIGAYSNSLDNMLTGTKQITDAVNGFWAPLAGNTNGLLPVVGVNNQQVDMTAVSRFPDVVRGIAQLPVPTGVPGVVPALNIPGQGFTTLPLPTSLPGADMLMGLADGIEAVYGIPGIDWIVGSLPPLSALIPGLAATQQSFQADVRHPLLGFGGSTSVSNTYIHTPGDTSITANLPVAQGVYTFPMDAAAGWWAAAPTMAVTSGGSTDFMVSVPTGAIGLQAPGGLGQAGIFGVAAVLPSANGLYVPAGATLSNLGIPALGFGMTHLNVSTGNYLGTDGINLNNGQNILVLQTPLTGALPIPIVYSLGGFNVGPHGIGYTPPSLFGISLISPIQIGTAPTGSDPLGIIPSDLIPVGDLLPTQLISVTGLASALFGVQDPSAAIGQGLTPAYNTLVAPLAQQVSNLLTQQYGWISDSLASSSLHMSQTFKDLTAWLNGQSATMAAVDQTDPAALPRVPAPRAVTLSLPTAPETRSVADAAAETTASASGHDITKAGEVSSGATAGVTTEPTSGATPTTARAVTETPTVGVDEKARTTRTRDSHARHDGGSPGTGGRLRRAAASEADGASTEKAGTRSAERKPADATKAGGEASHRGGKSAPKHPKSPRKSHSGGKAAA